MLGVMAIMAMAAAATAQVATTPVTFAVRTAVGSTSSAVPVTLTARAGGAVTHLTTLTGGGALARNPQEFTATGGSCANALLRSGQTCTVSLTFSPRFPGIQQEAAQAMAGGQVIASGMVSGVGNGSLPVLMQSTINKVAGDGDYTDQRDRIPATQAPIFLPSGLAVDAPEDLFFCDSRNNGVRRVDATTQVITTVAANGTPGGLGDGGQAIDAELSNPPGLVINGADASSSRIAVTVLSAGSMLFPA